MVAAIGVALLILIVIIVVIAVKKDDDDGNTKNNAAQRYSKAAVATDAEICSKVGADILRQNGTAVDSAIASMFCTGVINLHSCGIGGGAFLVLYKQKTKKFKVYDFREEAPLFASRDMFVKNPELSRYGKPCCYHVFVLFSY